MNSRTLIFTVLLFVALDAPAAGRKAPLDMHEFNVKCPAPQLLPKLDFQYHRCHVGDEQSCAEFVALLRQALPEYDCQRSFDKDYIVPALWLADAAAEDYIRLLSGLKTPGAQELFASSEFRQVLDGDLAEEFGPLSRQAARRLAAKAKHHRPPN